MPKQPQHLCWCSPPPRRVPRCNLPAGLPSNALHFPVGECTVQQYPTNSDETTCGAAGNSPNDFACCQAPGNNPDPPTTCRVLKSNGCGAGFADPAFCNFRSDTEPPCNGDNKNCCKPSQSTDFFCCIPDNTPCDTSSCPLPDKNPGKP